MNSKKTRVPHLRLVHGFRQKPPASPEPRIVNVLGLCWGCASPCDIDVYPVSEELIVSGEGAEEQALLLCDGCKALADAAIDADLGLGPASFHRSVQELLEARKGKGALRITAKTVETFLEIYRRDLDEDAARTASVEADGWRSAADLLSRLSVVVRDFEAAARHLGLHRDPKLSEMRAEEVGGHKRKRRYYSPAAIELLLSNLAEGEKFR